MDRLFITAGISINAEEDQGFLGNAFSLIGHGLKKKKITNRECD